MKRQAKNMVIDTNVLIHSPSSIFSFDDNNVIIPEVVIEELDNFKSESSLRGKSSRDAIKILEQLRQEGKLIDGIELEQGGLVKIEVNHTGEELPVNWDKTKPDNRILQTCIALTTENDNTVLVTKDVSLRVKADVVGVKAEDYRNDKSPNVDSQYKGRIEGHVVREVVDNLFETKKVKFSDINIYDKQGDEINELVENQYVTLKSPAGSALCIYKNGYVSHIHYSNCYPSGIRPRNAGQQFVIDALMRDVNESALVIIKGPAGTAKTLLSLATGLEKTKFNNTNEFKNILITRPNVLSEEIGFLPGSESEKTAPLFRPIYDNLSVILGNQDVEFESMKEKDIDIFEDLIKTESIGYIRGRSIYHQWLIVDEAQNLTPAIAKAIVTRAGKGTKVILAGDPEQVDHPYLNSMTNGLSYVSERMKGDSLTYQVTFEQSECERSKLSERASKRL